MPFRRAIHARRTVFDLPAGGAQPAPAETCSRPFPAACPSRGDWPRKGCQAKSEQIDDDACGSCGRRCAPSKAGWETRFPDVARFLDCPRAFSAPVAGSTRRPDLAGRRRCSRRTSSSRQTRHDFAATCRRRYPAGALPREAAAAVPPEPPAAFPRERTRRQMVAACGGRGASWVRGRARQPRASVARAGAGRPAQRRRISRAGAA